MITYANESLFYQDNIEKQINISFTGGSITNSNIRAEEFELEETLNAGDDINFGECNANKVSFVVGYYANSIAGKTITVSITPSGGSAFQLGVYKVLSDYPTADKRWRKIIAYDSLYDILKADVRSWYDTLLPNTSTTKTIKQIRDSFFSHFGITQKSATLPNDNITVTRSINPSCITGKTVLKAILELNACFGKIGRDGKFKYISLEKPTSGLFPATTLYPSTTLYPEKRGFVREENRRVYNSMEYQEYETKPIDRLMILDSRGDVQASVGTGNTNVYLIKDNFLVFGLDNTTVTNIANNIFPNISERFYRPAKINTIGNPCLEVGDGIGVTTVDGVNVETYIFSRKMKGIHSLKDNYESKGLEYRANDRNSPSEQIGIVKDNVRRIEADYVKTTYLEANYITANEISATYLKTDDISTITLSANQITTGTLDASVVTVSNLNATNISTGTLSTSRLDIDGLVASFSGKAISSYSASATYGYFENLYTFIGGSQLGFNKRTATIGGTTIDYWGW